MPALAKAKLSEISAGDPPRVENTIEVQFNPATLRLALSNQIEGGETRGRTPRQVIGANATVLSCDLVFDTADEGTAEQPRSVREKTAMVERFVLPRPQSQGANQNQVPPKARFEWGGLILEGIVDSVNVDFDHFAADGTPLRAKVGLSIREQDRRYQFLEAGRGANRSSGAPAPGGLGLGAVGGASLGISASASLGVSAGFSAGVSFGASAQVGVALGGETAAEFAARAGLDPGAWRGLGADLSGGLELTAGAEVAFDASLSSGLGPGATAGVAPATGGSLETAFGLAPESGTGTPAIAAERQAGFALSAAGGVGAALDTVAATRTQAAAAAARAGFEAPGPRGAAPPDARPALPSSARTPLASGGASSASPAVAASPPAPDPRAYGYGAPLRPRRAVAADERSGDLNGSARLRRAPSPIDPTPIPTVPPWERLPQRERGQAAPGRKPGKPCSCDCRGGKP